MTAVADKILKQALKLQPVERAELIEELFLSFDPDRQKRVDALWAEEAESRISAHDAGLMVADSDENVFTRINRR